MEFISTRNSSKDNESVLSAEAIKNGLAKDGGLYVPEAFPVISVEEGGEVVQHAEIERNEIIFRLEVT